MPRLTPNARRALVQDRQAQILTAAAKVFAAKGFERATIADIAREAHVAEGSIYNYFKSKSDLLVSIPRQMVEPAVTTFNRQVAGMTTPEPALTAIAEILVATVRQNAYIFFFFFTALPSLSSATRQKYLNQVVLYATANVETLLREQIRLGTIRQNLEPSIAARAFIGLFFPFIMLRDVLQVETNATWNYEQLVPELVTLFLHGTLAAHGKGKRDE